MPTRGWIVTGIVLEPTQSVDVSEYVFDPEDGDATSIEFGFTLGGTSMARPCLVLRGILVGSPESDALGHLYFGRSRTISAQGRVAHRSGQDRFPTGRASQVDDTLRTAV